jgi:uncharacterized membrane protein
MPMSAPPRWARFLLALLAVAPAGWWLGAGQGLIAFLWPLITGTLVLAFIKIRLGIDGDRTIPAPLTGAGEPRPERNRRGESDQRRSALNAPIPPFFLLMLALAFGLSAFVDLVTLRGDIERMNTVFKFSLQTWVLLAIVSAYGVTRLVQDFPWPSFRRLWLGTTVLLIGGAAIYPFAATPVRIGDRFATLPPTLDGLAYAASAVYRDEHGPIPLHWDVEVMRWFQENVDGSPVIAEGQTPLYRWGSRYSVHLGLPTILGWDWHETQQRPGAARLIEERKRDITALYSSETADVARRVLERYNVQYVIVGPVERLYYPERGLSKLEAMGELRVVYENEGVTVYEVVL